MQKTFIIDAVAWLFQCLSLLFSLLLRLENEYVQLLAFPSAKNSHATQFWP